MLIELIQRFLRGYEIKSSSSSSCSYSSSTSSSSSSESEEKIKEKCDPKTCWGECRGKGWCEIAKEWQKKIHYQTFFPNVLDNIKRKNRNKRKKNRRRKR